MYYLLRISKFNELFKSSKFSRYWKTSVKLDFFHNHFDGNVSKMLLFLSCETVDCI